jgi:hypothetical protein
MKHLIAIARFFGVPPTYFFPDDAMRQDAIPRRAGRGAQRRQGTRDGPAGGRAVRPALTAIMSVTAFRRRRRLRRPGAPQRISRRQSTNMSNEVTMPPATSGGYGQAGYGLRARTTAAFAGSAPNVSR